jgi:hypothetical protein
MPRLLMTPERIAGYTEPNRTRLEKLLDIFNKHGTEFEFYFANDLLVLLIDTNHEGCTEALEALNKALEKN